MESRAKALGHAIHPMLIPFPLGLLATAVVFDVIYLVTDRPGFALTSAYAMAAGIIGGLVAAPFGWADWFTIPADTRAKRVGLLHGVSNVVVIVLFAISWALRATAGGGTPTAWAPNSWALVCSFAAVALATVAGWLGGELVERLAVGVAEGANIDAPNSLSRRRRGAPLPAIGPTGN